MKVMTIMTISSNSPAFSRARAWSPNAKTHDQTKPKPNPTNKKSDTIIKIVVD